MNFLFTFFFLSYSLRKKIIFNKNKNIDNNIKYNTIIKDKNFLIFKDNLFNLYYFILIIFISYLLKFNILNYLLIKFNYLFLFNFFDSKTSKTRVLIYFIIIYLTKDKVIFKLFNYFNLIKYLFSYIEFSNNLNFLSPKGKKSIVTSKFYNLFYKPKTLNIRNAVFLSTSSKSADNKFNHYTYSTDKETDEKILNQHNLSFKSNETKDEIKSKVEIEIKSKDEIKLKSDIIKKNKLLKNNKISSKVRSRRKTK